MNIFYPMTSTLSQHCLYIITPLPGLSNKKDWELLTSMCMGGYIRLFGGSALGVEYGLDQNEIDYARQTMSKTWGVSIQCESMGCVNYITEITGLSLIH